MKRSLICYFVLLPSLFLSACGQEIQQLPSTTVSTVSTSEPSSRAIEDIAREGKTQLHFYQSSGETAANAALFFCDEYSIYIFEDGWDHQIDSIHGFTVNEWQSTESKDARLWIAKMDETDLQTAQSWIRDSFVEYDLLEDNRGGLGGTNADGHMIDAQIILTDSMSYIVIKMYSLENAEPFGVLLNAMADTLLLK